MCVWERERDQCLGNGLEKKKSKKKRNDKERKLWSYLYSFLLLQTFHPILSSLFLTCFLFLFSASHTTNAIFFISLYCLLSTSPSNAIHSTLLISIAFSLPRLNKLRLLHTPFADARSSGSSSRELSYESHSQYFFLFSHLSLFLYFIIFHLYILLILFVSLFFFFFLKLYPR